MNVVLHSRKASAEYLAWAQEIQRNLAEQGGQLYVSALYARVLAENQAMPVGPVWETIDAGVDLIVSLGGDGTFLETVHISGQHQRPILGINTGRMGFLATVPKKILWEAILGYQMGDYVLEHRSMLQLSCPGQPDAYVLNEVALLRQDILSVVAVHVHLDGVAVPVYWGDGVQVATPTGSTGYSLSCGGPIVLPRTPNFVVTPINPHNLSVRPLVIPDSTQMKLRVESRNNAFLLALDGRATVLPAKTDLVLCKAPFSAQVVNIQGTHLFDSLHQKLHWGLDIRNR